MSRVYLDHNATSPLRPEARERWLAVQDELRGNASSLHAAGRRARDHVDRARERVAAALGANEDEIVFTSGGTEANNLALRGVLAVEGPAAGLVTAAAEHASVLAAAERLAAQGHRIERLPVDEEGVPRVDRLADALARTRAGLVSLTAANNEVGALTPLAAVREVAAAARRRPWIHTDAVQALGRIPLALADQGIDLASFSAHKVGGPVGVGVLWRRRGVPLAPLVVGGAQEHGLRPGTENVAGIAAAALAIDLAVREQSEYALRVARLAAELWRTLHERSTSVRLLGPPLDSDRRLPNTLCIAVPNVDGKVLVTRLDLEGLEVSAGSACASGSLEPSHVLRAMGLDDDAARAGLRVSLGRDTTTSDCRRAAEILCKLTSPTRATSMQRPGL